MPDCMLASFPIELNSFMKWQIYDFSIKNSCIEWSFFITRIELKFFNDLNKYVKIEVNKMIRRPVNVELS